MSTVPTPEKHVFDKYQIFVIAILAFTQFSVVLDFMVLSPLGALVMKNLTITTSEFGQVVAAYAFSAFMSGLLAAGFADKFDRKKILLFFYIGFVAGTFLCGIAPDYQFLLVARIVTGIFGGVISSISFAIVTDLFSMQVRGRVMGFTQMSFAASQVLGIPVGLLLANHFDWHAPFLLIVGFSILVVFAIAFYMKPITDHLKIKSDRNPVEHLIRTVSKKEYLKGFLATALLATGGFMLMPFASDFSIHNLGLTQEQLPTLYMITGMFSVVCGPLIGKYSDKIGAYKIFFIGSFVSILVVAFYTRLGITPYWIIQTVNVVLFVAVASRIISSSALMSAVPDPQDRGAFMSINSSVQQFAGGMAAILAGKIVTKTPSGRLENYDILGYVVIVATIITMGMMYLIHLQVSKKKKLNVQPPIVPVTES
jgi:predicted MFS family arabinose efflux permease